MEGTLAHRTPKLLVAKLCLWLGWALFLAGLVSSQFLRALSGDHGGQTHPSPAVSWQVVRFAFAGMLLSIPGISIIRLGKRLSVETAEQVLLRDKRAPVLYLRSFRDDRDRSFWEGLVAIVLSAPRLFLASQEEHIAGVLGQVGPVIAIASARARHQALGAHRLYTTEEQWRDRVCELLTESRLVIILAPSTENAWWELAMASKLSRPSSILIWFPPRQSRNYDSFRRKVTGYLPYPLPPAQSPVQFVYFTEDWHARLSYYQHGNLRWDPTGVLVSITKPLIPFFDQNELLLPADRVADLGVLLGFALPFLGAIAGAFAASSTSIVK